MESNVILNFRRLKAENEEVILNFGSSYIMLRGFIKYEGRLISNINHVFVMLFGNDYNLIETKQVNYGDYFEFMILESGMYYMIIDNGCNLRLIDNIKIEL